MDLTVLVGWGVVSVIAAALVGIGFSVLGMDPPAYMGAKLLFVGAGLLIVIRLAVTLASSTGRTFDRVAVAFVVFGVIGVSVIETWRWVDARQVTWEELHKPKPAAAPLLPAPTAEPEKTQRPLAKQARIDVQWIDGIEPTVEIKNKSGGRIEIRATAKILDAGPTHKRRDIYSPSWREVSSKDWVPFDDNDTRHIVLATFVRRGYPYGPSVISVYGRSAAITEWEVDKFDFANIFVELETKPPLKTPYKNWYTMTWNAEAEILELGQDET